MQLFRLYSRISVGSQNEIANIETLQKLPSSVIQEPEVPGSIPCPASADLRRAVFSYRQKYVHEVLVNRLAGLSLSWSSVVSLIDHPNMTWTYSNKTTIIQLSAEKRRVSIDALTNKKQRCVKNYVLRR